MTFARLAGRPLRGITVRWFGAIFLILYLIAAGVVVVLDSLEARHDLEILLYAEAEALASYVASTGRLDFPELSTHEHTPVPVWMRVVHCAEVVAATPDPPPLPTFTAGERTKALRLVRGGDGELLAAVSHEIWNRPGDAVDVFAPARVLGQRRHRQILVLALTGLILLPVAGLGGWLLAQRTSRPIRDLVTSVRALDSTRLDAALEVPAAPREVAELAISFNELLRRLEETVAAMRRFTADASHELRTPVSILRTGLEVTLRRNRKPGEYRTLLRDNLKEIERVQRIVEGLLLLARDPRASESTPERRVDAAAVVREAVERMGPHAAEKHVTITCEVPAEVIVLGDADWLDLMVVNLLDNAVRHNPAGGAVTVRLWTIDGTARLSIADRGPGIPVGDRSQVFDRYFRGPSSEKPRGRTGGLGLSVVRWVAERHHGTVAVVEGDGPGACFEVVLPLAPPTS